MAFDPSQPFEAVDDKPPFDPVQPYESVAVMDFDPNQPFEVVTEQSAPTSNVIANMGRSFLGGAASGVADIVGGAAGVMASTGRNTAKDIADLEAKVSSISAKPSVFKDFTQAQIGEMQAAPEGYRTPREEAELASHESTLNNLRGLQSKDAGFQKSLEEFQTLSSEASKEAQTFFGQDPKRQDEFLSKLAAGAGSLPPYIASSLAGGPVASMLIGALQTGQNEYNAAIEAGKPELADEAMLKGMGIGMTEGAGVGGGLGKAAKGFAAKAWVTLKKAFEEGGQEWVQQTLSNLNASTFSGYDPERPAFEGSGEAFAIGALLGGGVEGVTQPFRNGEDVTPFPGTSQANVDANARTQPITVEVPSITPATDAVLSEIAPIESSPDQNVQSLLAVGADKTAAEIAATTVASQPLDINQVITNETAIRETQTTASSSAITVEAPVDQPLVRDASKPEQMTPEEHARYVAEREGFDAGDVIGFSADGMPILKSGSAAARMDTPRGTRGTINDSVERGTPVSAALVDGYNAENPDRPLRMPGYVKRGDLYVFDPSSATPVEAPSSASPVNGGAAPVNPISNVGAPAAIEASAASTNQDGAPAPSLVETKPGGEIAPIENAAADESRPASISLDDIVPALKSGEDVSEGQIGEEHKAIIKREISKGNTDFVDARHGFKTPKGFRTRAEMAGDLLEAGLITPEKHVAMMKRSTPGATSQDLIELRDLQKAKQDAAPSESLDSGTVAAYASKLPEGAQSVVMDVLVRGKSVEESASQAGLTPKKAQEAVTKARTYLASAKTVQGMPRERSYADEPSAGGRTDEVDDYLRKSEGRGGFVLVSSSVSAAINPATSTTPEAYRMSAFVQSVRNWWFGKGGALPKPLRTALAGQRQNIDSIKARGGVMAKDIQLDITRIKRGMKDKEAAQKMVNEALDGDRPMTDITDPGLRDSVERARNFIDALSKTTLDNGIVTGSMADTFRTNMGRWMRRYYSAFDPESGRTYDNVLKAAYEEPMKRSGLKDAKLATFLSTAETEVRKSRPGMTDGEVEAVLRGLLDRTTMEGIVTGQGSNNRVSKDISSLIRRKDIAPAIRNWMGEEKNPLLRFEKSINFMAQLITRHETQKMMREFGLANGLFSKTKTGRYTVGVAPDEMQFMPKRDPVTGEIVKDASGNPVGEFSTRTDKSLDVFRGLYTSPEFAVALNTMDGGVHGIQQQMGAIGKALSMFAAETKMAKVPLNPGSWMTNAIGGLMMNFANGTGTPLTPGKSGKLFSTAFQAMRADRPMSITERADARNVALREMHVRLVANGILNSNITMRDLEASTAEFEGSLLETNVAANRAVGAARLGYYGAELGSAIAGPVGGMAGGAVGAVTGAAIGGKAIKKGLQTFSQKSIGTMDNFWKTVAYLDNVETYIRAGKAPAEAAKISAEITRNTMPTYEKIPEGLRSLSKMGVISTFFQFNYEVIRNTFNTAAIGRAEMASGNPVLVQRGARRLAGVVAMTALASSLAAQALSRLLIDDDDDEKQKALNRSFVPPWDKNNGLIVTKLRNGSVSYVNQGYIIPQAQLTRAVTAALNGDGAEEAINNIFGAYGDDFISAGVHIGPLIEAAVNQKGFRSFLKQPEQGSQVTYKRGAEGFWERLAYVLDKTVKPGAVGEVEKAKKAVTGELAEYGRQYTLQERAVRMMGLRENTYDLNRTLEFRMRDLQSQWRNAGSVERNITRKNLPPEQAKKDSDYAEKEQARLKKEMGILKKDAETLGLNDNIQDTQKKAGVALELR